MKRLIILFLFSIPMVLFAQDTEEQNKLFVLETSLPGELNDFYGQEKIKNAYSIRIDLNPFYLRGDFDGDKIQDYALSIVDKKTSKKGILIYHTATKTHYIVGAGKSLRNRNGGGDDYSWMDAWRVYTKNDTKSGSGDANKMPFKGEAILAMKTESASGLIYWTGKEYLWRQQGD